VRVCVCCMRARVCVCVTLQCLRYGMYMVSGVRCQVWNNAIFSVPKPNIPAGAM
jgi:hypothetical protein